jgi:hypothetical protein
MTPGKVSITLRSLYGKQLTTLPSVVRAQWEPEERSARPAQTKANPGTNGSRIPATPSRIEAHPAIRIASRFNLGHRRFIERSTLGQAFGSSSRSYRSIARSLSGSLMPVRRNYSPIPNRSSLPLRFRFALLNFRSRFSASRCTARLMAR